MLVRTLDRGRAPINTIYPSLLSLRHCFSCLTRIPDIYLCTRTSSELTLVAVDGAVTAAAPASAIGAAACGVGADI